MIVISNAQTIWTTTTVCNCITWESHRSLFPSGYGWIGGREPCWYVEKYPLKTCEDPWNCWPSTWHFSLGTILRINCGNNFENDVVVEFNKCALSAKKCTLAGVRAHESAGVGAHVSREHVFSDLIFECWNYYLYSKYIRFLSMQHLV